MGWENKESGKMCDIPSPRSKGKVKEKDKHIMSMGNITLHGEHHCQ